MVAGRGQRVWCGSDGGRDDSDYAARFPFQHVLEVSFLESLEKEGRETGEMTGGTACRETTLFLHWWTGQGEATSIF